MNKDLYAIIIGFNKFEDEAYLPELDFAEKDALDIYETLIDPDYGNVPPENIRLITGKATREEVETALYVHAVQERGPQDTVLIYYSGHGFFAGDTPEAYLATPDTHVMKINKNPNAGLQMEYLRKKIFLAQPEKRAKNMILLLDCCYSGAFCPELKGGPELTPRALVDIHDFDSDGRVAFVSSSAKVVSRENKKIQNGVFTENLLLGLRGKAIEENTGEVTVSKLVAYVMEISPSHQQPILYGKQQRIVLFKPKAAQSSLTQEESTMRDARNFKHTALFPKDERILPLVNPIEYQVDCIDRFMAHLAKLEQQPESTSVLGNQILNSIRESLNAEFAFVEQIKNEYDPPRYKFWSDLPIEGVGLKDYADSIREQVYPLLIRKKAKLLPTRFGFGFEMEGSKGGGSHSIAIPLKLEYPREFIIISGVKENILKYGEVLGHALMSLYKATLEFSALDTKRIEDYLLDDIKRSFGHVPHHIYAKRFDKFKERLFRIEFWYEPVVALGKKTIEIDSWEALARDPETKAAPKELFDAAQLWGPEFLTELDLYCLRTATKDFSEKWKDERGEKMDALAINVYPETLFRTNYKKELYRITKEEELIKGKRLVLEISEKRPLSWVDRLESEFVEDPVDVFANQIQALSKSLGISFAIDDFGVGHSSTERLAKLELDHVKIDRDVLFHPHPQYTIKYVLDIVQESHKHPIKVVMEGFDGGSHVSLSELFNKLGILYIQGHLIRKASPTVADLDEETKKDLLDRINLSY